jgi:hypothetical protein
MYFSEINRACNYFSNELPLIKEWILFIFTVKQAEKADFYSVLLVRVNLYLFLVSSV